MIVLSLNVAENNLVLVFASSVNSSENAHDDGSDDANGSDQSEDSEDQNPEWPSLCTFFTISVYCQPEPGPNCHNKHESEENVIEIFEEDSCDLVGELHNKCEEEVYHPDQ